MKFVAYGTRGSLPSPSTKTFQTAKYGGNTTCYYLEAGPFDIIFDMGSGARVLGNDLMAQGKIAKNFILLLSHYHSDHTQGIGFHVPFYIPSNFFHIHGFSPDYGHTDTYISNVVEACLVDQQQSPFFPVPHTSLPAKKTYVTHDKIFGETCVYFARSSPDQKNPDYEYSLDLEAYSDSDPDNLRITTIPLNHPNGCLGFRIDYLGRSLVYCTDNEPFAYSNNKINTLGGDADLMLLDGQYTVEQISKIAQGFGHGQPEICVDQAVVSGAKKLIIHHHDPNHDDKMIAKMESECLKYYKKLKDKGSLAEVEFCQEGMSWEV